MLEAMIWVSDGGCEEGKRMKEIDNRRAREVVVCNDR